MLETLCGDEYLEQPAPGRLLHFPTTTRQYQQQQPDNGSAYVVFSEKQQDFEEYRELQAELEPLPFGKLSLTTIQLDFTSSLAIEALAHQANLLDGLVVQLTNLAGVCTELTQAELCREIVKLAGKVEKARHQKLAATALALELTVEGVVEQAEEKLETVTV